MNRFTTSQLLGVFFVLLAAFGLAACGGSETAAPVPIEVTRLVEQVVEVDGAAPQLPPRPKNIVICLPTEPSSLYLYGDTTEAAVAVRHALYTNYITTLSYDYQADGLAKIPSLGDGDAAVNVVEVGQGDRVRRADDSVGPLRVGDTVVNAAGEPIVFDGTPIAVGQMVVEFTMEPTVWSDGEPVKASDSVYSFQLAADPATTATRYAVERTAAYEATGPLSVRWTGLPGFLDSSYFTKFWPPLPEHAWGQFSAIELQSADESNRFPLGDGPFRIVEWRPGERIHLTRNDYYYRAAEGLPHLDSVTFRFLPDREQRLAELAAGRCDIVTHDGLDADAVPFLLEAEASGALAPHFQTGLTYQHIDFNVEPYGDYAAARYDWFEDARVRQAMMLCVDRQGMVDDLLYGRSEVVHTYVPAIHPLYPREGEVEWPYDPQRGNALLDEAGYDRRDAEGFRLDPGGARFAPTLGTTAGDTLRQQISQRFRENMAACGIDVRLHYLPATEWFADGPEGVLFGRQFDLGLFSWLTDVQPACDLYMGARIPGPAGETNPRTGLPFTGWAGDNQNLTGWSNADYDLACRRGLGSLPGTLEYAAAHAEAQRIFARELPSLPLFLSLKVGATQPRVQNFKLDPTQLSELYNIQELDVGP